MFTAIKKIEGTAWSYQPSQYDITYNDVSNQASGRTANGEMYKNRIGTCVKINMQWKNVTGTVAQAVLAAFQKNYISIEYYNARYNTYKTSTFYIGDREAKCYNSTLDIWTLSFNAIERNPVSDEP